MGKDPDSDDVSPPNQEWRKHSPQVVVGEGGGEGRERGGRGEEGGKEGEGRGEGAHTIAHSRKCNVSLTAKTSIVTICHGMDVMPILIVSSR